MGDTTIGGLFRKPANDFIARSTGSTAGAEPSPAHARAIAARARHTAPKQVGTLEWDTTHGRSNEGGYITPRDGSPKIFVHFSVMQDGAMNAKNGALLEYRVEQGPKGPVAADVTVYDGKLDGMSPIERDREVRRIGREEPTIGEHLRAFVSGRDAFELHEEATAARAAAMSRPGYREPLSAARSYAAFLRDR